MVDVISYFLAHVSTASRKPVASNCRPKRTTTLAQVTLCFLFDLEIFFYYFHKLKKKSRKNKAAQNFENRDCS